MPSIALLSSFNICMAVGYTNNTSFSSGPNLLTLFKLFCTLNERLLERGVYFKVHNYNVRTTKSRQCNTAEF